MTDRRRTGEMSEEELREKLRNGELTDEEFQEQMRRIYASRRPEDLPDSTERDTVEGFGSGQGMGRPQNKEGREMDKPDERGFPRTKDEEWPVGSAV